MLQRFARGYGVELAPIRAQHILMASGLRVPERVRALLSPWDNWRGLYTTVLADLLAQAPDASPEELVERLLQGRGEAVQAFHERHPDSGFSSRALLQAMHVLRQKLAVHEWQHPLDFLARIEYVTSISHGRGVVVASPQIEHHAGSPFEYVRLYLADRQGHEPQPERAHLWMRPDGTVVFSCSVHDLHEDAWPLPAIGQTLSFRMTPSFADGTAI
ncbi:hypothetical protein [Deinococcus multiflagellatus]|uniref:Uncharacterized protein n=1 Tax=Deinococcus multiflagellatus TaxID=1656887 RepID=A0ABW1ZP38_9DEIO|nr:hypothetical protein [Deinococcus multiflagellatus]MBZ9715832.1 hypothetical protein [Deinococcus multiflagellatus]